MKNVLVITSSLRAGSNSDILAEEFAAGARAAGNSVEVLSLKGRSIAFCRGCMACQKTQRCAINDDARAMVDKMKSADAIAFATPVYYYCMSGQLKTLLDRANPLFPADYAFRDIYLLATAADTDASAMDGTVKGIEGWVSCFEKARLAGVVRGLGADDAGDVRANAAALDEARALGGAV